MASFSSALPFRAPSLADSSSAQLRKRSREVSARHEPSHPTPTPYSPTSVYEEHREVPTVFLVEPTPDSELPPPLTRAIDFELLHPVLGSPQLAEPPKPPAKDRHGLHRSLSASSVYSDVAQSLNSAYASTSNASHPAYLHTYNPYTSNILPSLPNNAHAQTHPSVSVRILPTIHDDFDEDEYLPLVPPTTGGEQKQRFRQPFTSPRPGPSVTFTDIADYARGLATPRMFTSIGRTTSHFTQKFPRPRKKGMNEKSDGFQPLHAGLASSRTETNGFGLDGDSLSIGRWTGFKWFLVVSVLLVSGYPVCCSGIPLRENLQLFCSSLASLLIIAGVWFQCKFERVPAALTCHSDKLSRLVSLDSHSGCQLGTAVIRDSCSRNTVPDLAGGHYGGDHELASNACLLQRAFVAFAGVNGYSWVLLVQTSRVQFRRENGSRVVTILGRRRTYHCTRHGKCSSSQDSCCLFRQPSQ